MNILFNLKNLFILAIILIIIGLSLSSEASIKVEVKGEVTHPGVYKVTDELRVEDILKLAGLREESDLSNLNLSRKVYDEMVIIFPTKEKIENVAYKLI